MFENYYSEANRHVKDSVISKLIDGGITPHEQSQKVYKYVSLETAKKIFLKSSFRFSSPLKFNDPHELNTGFVSQDISRPELLQRLLDQPTVQGLNSFEILHIKSRPTEELLGAYSTSLDYYKKGMLLFCASRIFDETLMWSHYADSHKGICIGFYLPTVIPELDAFTCNVHYPDKAGQFNILNGNVNDRSIELYKWINTKSKRWEYEQEVRCCILNMQQRIPSATSGYYDIIFPKDLFSEIIFGSGVDEDTIGQFRDLLREAEYPIEVFAKMEISRSTFDLEYRPLS